MNEVAVLWCRTKTRRMMIVRQDFVGENKQCPKCKERETVYVHLDHKKEDPVAPKYLCVACKHEWDDEDKRL